MTRLRRRGGMATVAPACFGSWPTAPLPHPPPTTAAAVTAAAVTLTKYWCGALQDFWLEEANVVHK